MRAKFCVTFQPYGEMTQDKANSPKAGVQSVQEAPSGMVVSWPRRCLRWRRALQLISELQGIDHCLAAKVVVGDEIGLPSLGRNALHRRRDFTQFMLGIKIVIPGVPGVPADVFLKPGGGVAS